MSLSRVSPRLFTAFMIIVLAAGLLAGGGANVTPALANGIACRVDIDAAPGGDGTSWALAYDDLQSALGNIACFEIWVAEGVHIPGASETDTFSLDPGVGLYGGFAGTEVARADRDWNTNLTVLSGDLLGDDTNVNGVVVDDSDIVGENSDHILWLTGATTTTVIDGFTITGGQADGLVIPEYNGAGIYCPDECDVTVSNVVFSGNMAGYGAGFYNRSTAGVVSTPSFTNVTFTGGYVDAQGGGIWVEGAGATVNTTLTDVTFNDNEAGSSGGGFVSFAGNAASSTANPVLTDVVFTGNTAFFYGGGMMLATGGGDGDATLDRVAFIGNSATGGGGGLFNSAGANATGTANAILSNVVFSGNSTAGNGGAVLNLADGSATAAPQFVNVTFYNNSAASGGAIYNHDTDNTGVANPGVHNSIFWGNSTNWQDSGTNATGSIEYSDVQGYCGSTPAACGAGNIMIDPLFLDAGSGDLRVESSSLVIDAGINSAVPGGVIYDHDLRDRFIDNPLITDIGSGIAPIVDMGAFENQLACPTGAQLYVDQEATGIGDGTSWADALVDVLDALAVTEGCGGGDIWVAEGVYKPGASQSNSFNVAPGTGLYGGFAGTESLFAQRDWYNHPTILSGDIGGDDDGSNADGNFINETYADIVGANNYNVLSLTGTSVNITASTVVDGFTVTGADGFLGGGLWCNGFEAICSPTLQNLIFSGNRADSGGAIMNFGDGGESSPAISNVTFVGNHATDDGGAIYNDGASGGNSSPTFTNVTFEGNSAANGGAIYNDGASGGESSPSLANVTFSGNSAAFDGGAMYNDGFAGVSSPSLAHVTFSDNSAAYEGGAILNNGAGGTSNPALNGVILWGNTVGISGSGPQIHNNTAAPSLSYSVVEAGCASIPDAACGTGNLATDPMLGPLADNGGATLTMALWAGSSAIDTGDDAACAAPPVNGVDQRGISRPRGPQCDIGAYERPTTPADFAGEAVSDVALYRSGAWLFYDFDTALPAGGIWTGNPGGSCIAAPMDYDGDATKDFSMLCGGAWHFYNDDGSYNKGIWVGNVAGQVPVPADYFSDNADDVMLFRAGAWLAFDFGTGAYLPGSSAWTGLPGGAGTPAPMDYNDDGKADRTFFSSTGAWHFYNWDGSYHQGIWAGNVAGQLPVPGDYDGDGREDVMVFRSGAWLSYDFDTGLYVAADSVWTGAPPPPPGGGAMKPAPIDYDGDCRLDFGVFSGGPWHFYEDDGTYNKGIWVGIDPADQAISRRPLP